MSESAWIERLAVCSWSLHPESPKDLCRQLHEVGIPRTQLALGPLADDNKWIEADEVLEDNGIEIVSGMFGCVGEDYSTLESIRRTGGVVPDETWERNWKNIREVAEVADDLNLGLVSFHAGFLPEDEADPAYGKLLERLRQIADLFDRCGIHLGFETGQEDAATLKGFLDRLERPNVGVNFDPANMILYGKGDPVAAVEALMGCVRQVHIKDATPADTPGQWGSEVPVGTGAVDWEAFLGALRAGGFNGYLAIEREAGEQRIPDIRSAREFIATTMEKVVGR